MYTGHGNIAGDMSPTAPPELVICHAALILSEYKCTPVQCKDYIS